jgi:hypothetical protein
LQQDGLSELEVAGTTSDDDRQVSRRVALTVRELVRVENVLSSRVRPSPSA